MNVVEASRKPHDSNYEVDKALEEIAARQRVATTVRIRHTPPPSPRIQSTMRVRIPKDDSDNQSDTAMSHLSTSEDDVAVEIYNDFRNFRIISAAIDKSFADKYYLSSAALDIIAMYLKGQKILYIEAKTYCEQFLNMLMLPAILISAIATVVAPNVDTYEYGSLIISSLTGFNSFLLAVISYLKLDAKAEAHKTTSYQFDKLQSLVEFHSGKVLFFKDSKALEIVNMVEEKVAEIKDNNQFIIPESVRNRFHTIFCTNVFTRVKKIENDENEIKNKLKSVVTKIHELQKTSVGERNVEWQQKIHQLEKEKTDCFNSYCSLRNSYLELDSDFNKEIEKNRNSLSRRLNPCSCLKT